MGPVLRGAAESGCGFYLSLPRGEPTKTGKRVRTEIER
jgi:hypothetical protein